MSNNFIPENPRLNYLEMTHLHANQTRTGSLTRSVQCFEKSSYMNGLDCQRRLAKGASAHLLPLKDTLNTRTHTHRNIYFEINVNVVDKCGFKTSIPPALCKACWRFECVSLSWFNISKLSLFTSRYRTATYTTTSSPIRTMDFLRMATK